MNLVSKKYKLKCFTAIIYFIVTDMNITIMAVDSDLGNTAGNITSSPYCGDSKTFYLNRMKVEKGYRNKGLSKLLLQLYTEILDRKKIDVLLDIDPYPDCPISIEKLTEIYERYGFIETDIGGYLQYIRKTSDKETK